MSKTVVANRGLGILAAYLNHRPEIQKWLLPSTICFSVPALFTTLGKEIVFYDFTYNSNRILKNIQGTNTKTGILVVDYYGMEWPKAELSKLRSICSCLIQDSSLAIPRVETELGDVDLRLFSTGKRKVVELGYGAFAHSRDEFTLAVENQPCLKSVSEAYDRLDRSWRERLGFVSRSLFEAPNYTSWIDLQTNNVPDCYFEQIKQKLPAVMQHKECLNSIYRKELPEELLSDSISCDWRFNIFVSKPELVFEALQEQELFASRHYPNVSHHFTVDSTRANQHILADRVESHIINLFNDRHFSKKDAQTTASIISELFAAQKIQAVAFNLVD